MSVPEWSPHIYKMSKKVNFGDFAIILAKRFTQCPKNTLIGPMFVPKWSPHIYKMSKKGNFGRF